MPSLIAVNKTRDRTDRYYILRTVHFRSHCVFCGQTICVESLNLKRKTEKESERERERERERENLELVSIIVNKSST